MPNAALTRLLREHLLSLEAVKKHGPVRRASTVFSGDSISESIYFLDSGFVKIVRKGADGKEVIVSIVSPGQIFGEQAIAFRGFRNASAEVLQEGVIYEIPRTVFLEFCRLHPEAWQLVSEILLERQRDLEQKISLLCLQDVEARILYYLGSLAHGFGVNAAPTEEYALPISQSELANLIGATRETTSTTLNSLARRGVVRLGRRLLTVSSAENLRSMASDRSAHAARS